MPASFILDSPIAPHLDLAGARSQLFQVPPSSSASSALYRSISKRKRSRPVESPFDRTSPTFIFPDDHHTETDTSAELDYRPSRYREPPLPRPLDASVESLSDSSGVRRKRSRRDPSSLLAPSPTGPDEKFHTASADNYPAQSTPGWSRTVLDVVGKVWEFCWTGAFRGFYAGGGQGYAMTAEDDASRMDAERSAEKQGAMHTPAGRPLNQSTPVPGEYPEDDLHRNWVMVSRECDDHDASPSTKARRVHRRTNSGHRRRQSGKKPLMTYPSAMPTKSHFSSPAKPRETPVSVETQRYMAQKRRMEREEDASLRRLNQQLQAMIREGQQALGTRVEVDDFMED